VSHPIDVPTSEGTTPKGDGAHANGGKSGGSPAAKGGKQEPMSKVASLDLDMLGLGQGGGGGGGGGFAMGGGGGGAMVGGAGMSGGDNPLRQRRRKPPRGNSSFLLRAADSVGGDITLSKLGIKVRRRCAAC
jgi:hypothetical protein